MDAYTIEEIDEQITDSDMELVSPEQIFGFLEPLAKAEKIRKACRKGLSNSMEKLFGNPDLTCYKLLKIWDTKKIIEFVLEVEEMIFNSFYEDENYQKNRYRGYRKKIREMKSYLSMNENKVLVKKILNCEINAEKLLYLKPRSFSNKEDEKIFIDIAIEIIRLSTKQ